MNIRLHQIWNTCNAQKPLNEQLITHRPKAKKEDFNITSYL